jgi:hypothetical protein
VRNPDGSFSDVLDRGGGDQLNGLFSSIFGSVAKIAAPVASMIPGVGPIVGGAIGAVGNAIGNSGGGGQPQPMQPQGIAPGGDTNQLLSLTYSGIANILKAVFPVTVPIIGAASGQPAKPAAPKPAAAAPAKGGGGGAALLLVGGLLLVGMAASKGRRR